LKYVVLFYPQREGRIRYFSTNREGDDGGGKIYALLYKGGGTPSRTTDRKEEKQNKKTADLQHPFLRKEGKEKRALNPTRSASKTGEGTSGKRGEVGVGFT